jgi:methyltransferase (TIGR00027 family)
MRQKQSSTSALGVALIRAIETQKPEAERICSDPIARAFIPTISYTLSKLVIDSGLYERMAPGATAFVAVRERCIDDFLKACLAEGLDQVVLLGAGFDTRAYRIAGIEKTRVFEIDHPATQAVKLKRLKKVIDPIPANVTFIPLDFNTQTLSERLPASGYNEQGKTLFIWQGVTYFLTAEGVDSTLAFIANHSGPGSTLIFDYFYNEVLQDPSRSDVKMLRRAAQMTGEEYMFGIDQGQIGPFLTRRGFCEVRNLTLEDLKQLYFTGPNAGRVVPAGIAIASARVNKAEDQSKSVGRSG